MHLRIVLGSRGLGENVGGGAGNDDDFDVIGVLEGRQHVLGVGALEIAAIHADVKRLGFRLGGGLLNGEREQREGRSSHKALVNHGIPLSVYNETAV